MIQRTASGKYLVKSEKTGKSLSRPLSKADAVRRIAAIEYFKVNKASQKKGK